MKKHNIQKIYRTSMGVLFGSTLLLFALIIGINVFMHTSAEPFVVTTDSENLSTDAVMILWSKVYSDGRLSRAVKERADTAIALRKAGKARKILVSGDNRTRRYDEVTTIKNYLFEQEIPSWAVFLDFAGLDTYDSMYRAQYIFQVDSLLIPTQAFHVERSVFIARSLGIDAYGVITDTYTLPQLRRLYVREFFARAKAWIEVYFGALPHHLGEEIPIDGPANSM
jgi:SanA protein